jgi:acyl-CoA thioesterase-1
MQPALIASSAPSPPAGAPAPRARSAVSALPAASAGLACSSRPVPAGSLRGAPGRRRARAALAALLAMTAVACHRAPPNLDSPGKTIACLGDSITAGVGAGAGRGFVAVLAERLGRDVLDDGVPGDTAGEGLARLPQVLAQDPWLVIVELGGNDILRQVPIEQTEEALGEIVRQLLAARILPVLVAVSGPFGSRHSDMYDRVGSRYHVPVLRKVLREILLDPALKADEVHPNDEGHARLAAAIAAEIQPWITERRRLGHT